MDVIKKYKAVFVDHNLEDEYRLDEYKKQVAVFIKILLVCILAHLYLITSDYAFHKGENIFYVLLSLRISNSIYYLILIFLLKKELSLKQYDYLIVTWLISLLVLVPFIDYFRPGEHMGYIIFDAITVLFVYQILAVRISNILTIAITFSVVEMLILVFFKQQFTGTFLTSVILSFLLANIFGYLFALRNQINHRRQFYLLKRERELKDELEKSNQDKDKIFSVLAHDLKNPFNSIYNNSQLLLNEHKNLGAEDLHDSLVLLNESSEKIKILLTDLLEWARFQMDKLHLKKENTNLYDVFRKNMEMFEQQIIEKGIILKADLKKDFFVNVDVHIINTVLRNLISNAVKFTSREGIILISAKRNDGNLEIKVKDTGIGIDEKNLEKLFSTGSGEFSKPGTENEMGSGIGLYICRELVTLHGGEILVFSEPDQGTTFKVVIPQ